MMMMLNAAIPVYQKDKICFAREEKKGHQTLALEHNPTNIHLLNATGRLILNLCDGKNSLENIHNALKKHFPDTSSDNLQHYLNKFLTNMSIQGLVNWADDYNPLWPRDSNSQIEISENICVKRATEKEFRDIVVFVQSVIGCGQKNVGHEDFVVIASPIVYSGMYCDLMIRARMFNYSERFFFLECDGEKIGLLCIMDDYPNSTRGIVSLLVLKSKTNACENIQYLFKGAIANFNNTCHKFKCNLTTDHDALNELDTCLHKIGFVREGVYKDEYGNGVDEWVYGKKLTEVLYKP
jgi:hypothetical protein